MKPSIRRVAVVERSRRVAQACLIIYRVAAVKALTMSHDGALPVIKLRVLLNERTDCEWITLDSCFFAGLETASLHFPLAACSFWIWGYFYIHYQESHIVQWHLCPAPRKWTPTVLAMGCHGLSLWDWWGRLLALVRVDSSVSWSLKEPPWHRQSAEL